MFVTVLAGWNYKLNRQPQGGIGNVTWGVAPGYDESGVASGSRASSGQAEKPPCGGVNRQPLSREAQPRFVQPIVQFRAPGFLDRHIHASQPRNGMYFAASYLGFERYPLSTPSAALSYNTSILHLPTLYSPTHPWDVSSLSINVD
jgi:hypothetical protein